jgi:hypothetical protein
MKTLDVSVFGVQELNAEEMKTVDGGGFWAIFGTICSIVGVVTGDPFLAFFGVFLGGLEATNGYGL